MALVSLNEVLPQAKAKKYAIPHFNSNGLLWVKSMLIAAEELQSPFIIAVSDRMVDYIGGFNLIKSIVSNLYQELSVTVPIVLHFDHGKTVDRCLQAIEAGFNSIMYDGSHLSFAENLANTTKLANIAHDHGITIEAEVGSIGGTEDGITGGILYASMEECQKMVVTAKIDALAAALGSVHGTYIETPKLNFELMQEISDKLQVPLVLHGASGISNTDMQKAVQYGHAKINFNTELNLTWSKALRDSLDSHPNEREPAIINKSVQDAMINKIKEIIILLGSNNRA